MLPVKSTLELQKRYMAFINRDKVSAFAVGLWGTTLCGVGSSQPQVASDSRMLGVRAKPSDFIPVHSDTENCHK